MQMLDRLSENNKLVLIEFKNFILSLIVLIDFLFIGIILFNPISSYNLSFFINFDTLICFLLFLNLIYTYYKSDEKIIPFIRHHILEILSIIPYNYIYLRFFPLDGFRFVQILNIFKISTLRENYIGSFKYFVYNRLIKVISLLLICYLIITSIILQQVDSSFTTFFNSLWYNIVTLSGVGYGDITPVSITGKVMGIFTIIIGIMFVSVFTATIASIYMERNEEAILKNAEKEFDLIENQINTVSVKVDKLENDLKLLNEKIDILIDKMDDEEE